jgi:hypothetical protein
MHRSAMDGVDVVLLQRRVSLQSHLILGVTILLELQEGQRYDLCIAAGKRV